MFSFLGNVAIALAGIGGFLLLIALIPFFYLIHVLSKLWKLWRARERRETYTFAYEPPRH